MEHNKSVTGIFSSSKEKQQKQLSPLALAITQQELEAAAQQQNIRPNLKECTHKPASKILNALAFTKLETKKFRKGLILFLQEQYVYLGSGIVFYPIDKTLYRDGVFYRRALQDLGPSSDDFTMPLEFSRFKFLYCGGNRWDPI